jgi:hypothetical protein
MQRVSFGPAQTLAAVAVALGIGSFVYRLLHAADLGDSAAFFIGIPSVMAFAAAFIAVRLRANSVIGITLKTITIGLLLSGPLLGEGFICVLLAAPLFYAVGILVAIGIEVVRRFARSRRSSTLGLLVLPLLAFSLEGAVPGLAFPRQATSVAERTLDTTPEMVEATLAQPPHFDVPLPGVLGIGFPRPDRASGQGLAAGDRRVVTFVVPRGGRQRDLVMEVADRGPGWVRFRPVSDATKIAEWLTWQSADVSWTDLGDGRTRVRWALTYQRSLDPAWYFGPWESLVTTLAADYLIQSAAAPT